jgi:predicted dehydrogenase
LHAELTIAAARAGVGAVICEKPMAVGLGAADRMLAACQESGTRLVVSHQRRFTPGWEKARELVQQGAIGEPLWVTCNVLDGLLNCGTHAIDGSRFALGDPEAVWVMGAVARDTDRHERDVPIEDGCLGLVHFAGGAQLFIQSDLYREKAAGGGAFEIRGTQGLLEVSETRVRMLDASGWQQQSLRLAEHQIRPIGGHANGDQVRELIAWIEGRIPEHRGSGRQARHTVEIMMALHESARHHQVVRLPLPEKEYPLLLMVAEGRLPVRRPGRYDIRGFLRRDNIDQAEYKKLRAQGVGHFQALQELHRRQPQP